MKKRMSFLCAGLCLLLAGCGGGETEAQVRSFTQSDLTTVLECGAFSEELEQVDSELICALYGIEESAVAECAGYFSTGATAEELVFFAAADENGTESIKAACELRVEDQILAYEDYGPAEVEKLENAVLQVRGNTVLVVVAADGDAVNAAVDGLK